MDDIRREYLRYNEEKGDYDLCPINDLEGKILGVAIINLPAYFDENPELRKENGWILHERYNPEKDLPDFDKQTQFISVTMEEVDEYTVRDVVRVMDKSEEMLLLDEMFEAYNPARGTSFLFHLFDA